MKHYLGLSEYHLRQKNIEQPVVFEPALLTSAHVLVTGMSGTGKSTQSVRMLQAAAQAGYQVDIMDVHEELDGISGAVDCKLSQHTGYGYNPLVLDTDLHAGGVNRQVDFVVGLIKDVTPAFGPRQEAALRYLLQDTYAAAGIRQNDPRTWHKQRITEAQRQQIVDANRWQELRSYYPTLEDLRSYARRKVIALTIGGDNACVTAFEALRRTQGKLQSALTRSGRAGDDGDREKLQNQIATLKAKAIETYATFIDKMETGREIDDVLKYTSVEVLTSVMQRLDLLAATGILRANEPPFGDARVRVHKMKSLTTEQQILYVKLRLRAAFERVLQLGATANGKDIRHVFFLDEASKYFSKAPDDIINVVAKEGRKFGLVLWCSAQEPTAFPESFLTNVGCTMVLGIHAKYWKQAASLLRLDEKTLQFIRHGHVCAVKLQLTGKADPPFVNVVVPHPGDEHGRRAARYAA